MTRPCYISPHHQRVLSTTHPVSALAWQRTRTGNAPRSLPAATAAKVTGSRHARHSLGAGASRLSPRKSPRLAAIQCSSALGWVGWGQQGQWEGQGGFSERVGAQTVPTRGKGNGGSRGRQGQTKKGLVHSIRERVPKGKGTQCSVHMDFKNKSWDFKDILCCEIILVRTPAITPDTLQGLSPVSCILEFITLVVMLSVNLAALTFLCALVLARPTVTQDPRGQGMCLVLGS